MPCRQLKISRTHFLNLVNNAGSEVGEVTVAFTEYLGLARGLVEAPQGGESKLRTLTTFKWTNSLQGRTPRYPPPHLPPLCVCVEDVLVVSCLCLQCSD